MVIYLKTQSGTKYTLDTDTRSWKRERKPEDCKPGWESNDFEPSEGTYAQVSFVFGGRLRLVNAPADNRFDDAFMITSTPIIGIEVYEPDLPMSKRAT